MHQVVFMNVWGVLDTLCPSTIPPNTFCGGRVRISTLVANHFPPTHACHNNTLITHQSLFSPCLVFAACKCIPLHPSEPIPTLLSPSLPFYVQVHICVFWRELSRPYMVQKHTLPTHLCLCFSCFFCSCVSPNSIAPVQTHAHPHIPVRTRPHPSFTLKICVFM